MKKIIKMLNLIVAIIILLSVILPVVSSTSKVFATAYTIQYHGKVKYGESTVGSFTVNGTRAFCIDHKKTTPSTGIVATDEIYNDINIAKCLYYRMGRSKTVEWFYK